MKIEIKLVEGMPEDRILLMPEKLIAPMLVYGNLGQEKQLEKLLEDNKENIVLCKNIKEQL